jgi:hypothetical protein
MLGNSQFRRLDEGTLLHAGQQLGELVLRLAFGSLETHILDVALAGRGIAAVVEFQLESSKIGVWMRLKLSSIS